MLLFIFILHRPQKLFRYSRNIRTFIIINVEIRRYCANIIIYVSKSDESEWLIVRNLPNKMKESHTKRWIEFVAILNYLPKNIRSFLSIEFPEWCYPIEKYWIFRPIIDVHRRGENNSLVWKFQATRIALTPAWENWQGTKKLGAIARRILLAAENRGYSPDLGYFRGAIEARFEREIGFSKRDR